LRCDGAYLGFPDFEPVFSDGFTDRWTARYTPDLPLVEQAGIRYQAVITGGDESVAVFSNASEDGATVFAATSDGSNTEFNR
jgi:hypothetical protein